MDFSAERVKRAHKPVETQRAAGKRVITFVESERFVSVEGNAQRRSSLSRCSHGDAKTSWKKPKIVHAELYGSLKPALKNVKSLHASAF